MLHFGDSCNPRAMSRRFRRAYEKQLSVRKYTEYSLQISLQLGDWDTVNMAKATQLAQESGRFMRGSSLIGVQTSSCGSGK